MSSWWTLTTQGLSPRSGSWHPRVTVLWVDFDIPGVMPYEWTLTSKEHCHSSGPWHQRGYVLLVHPDISGAFWLSPLWYSRVYSIEWSLTSQGLCLLSRLWYIRSYDPQMGTDNPQTKSWVHLDLPVALSHGQILTSKELCPLIAPWYPWNNVFCVNSVSPGAMSSEWTPTSKEECPWNGPWHHRSNVPWGPCPPKSYSIWVQPLITGTMSLECRLTSQELCPLTGPWHHRSHVLWAQVDIVPGWISSEWILASVWMIKISSLNTNVYWATTSILTNAHLVRKLHGSVYLSFELLTFLSKY